MPNTNRKSKAPRDAVLEAIANELDISQSDFEKAQKRYEALGRALEKDSGLGKLQPLISPQGSFLIGTVVRPIKGNGEIDVDLVCQLRSASVSEFSQQILKQLVGTAVESYRQSRNMNKPAKEKRRCWTLSYEDDVRFHADILPAIPDASGYEQMLKDKGHIEKAQNKAMVERAIAITDWDHPNYRTRGGEWPLSNPFGYAAWFSSRKKVRSESQKLSAAARTQVDARVDDLPDSRVRVPLQIAVQLLKRHRDCMFAEDDENKPISIIITTLAALAYQGEDSISGTLRSILSGMDAHIGRGQDGTTWIPNPINPSENFADKWVEAPIKEQKFRQWLQQAQEDFGEYLDDEGSGDMSLGLRIRLGDALVTKVLATLGIGAATSTGAGATSSANRERTKAAVESSRRRGTATKPWATS